MLGQRLAPPAHICTSLWSTLFPAQLPNSKASPIFAASAFAHHSTVQQLLWYMYFQLCLPFILVLLHLSHAVALPSRCCVCSRCCPLRLPFARCHKRAQGKADGAAAEAAAAAGGRAAAAPKVITLFADAARAAAVLSLPPVPVPLPVLPRRCGCCPPSRCCGCSCWCSLRLPLARCQQRA